MLRAGQGKILKGRMISSIDNFQGAMFALQKFGMVSGNPKGNSLLMMTCLVITLEAHMSESWWVSQACASIHRKSEISQRQVF